MLTMIVLQTGILPTPQLYSQKQMYKSISPTWTETQMLLVLCMTEQQFL